MHHTLGPRVPRVWCTQHLAMHHTRGPRGSRPRPHAHRPHGGCLVRTDGAGGRGGGAGGAVGRGRTSEKAGMSGTARPICAATSTHGLRPAPARTPRRPHSRDAGPRAVRPVTRIVKTSFARMVKGASNAARPSFTTSSHERRATPRPLRLRPLAHRQTRPGPASHKLGPARQHRNTGCTLRLSSFHKRHPTPYTCRYPSRYPSRYPIRLSIRYPSRYPCHYPCRYLSRYLIRYGLVTRAVTRAVT